MIFELTTFCILVLLMIDFEAANAALTCNVASTLKKFVPNKKGAIEAISGLTILTGMDGGNADNIFTQAGSKTKDEVATMCSGFKAQEMNIVLYHQIHLFLEHQRVSL